MMKRFILFLMPSLVLTLAPMAQPADTPADEATLKVMTFNIRYNNPGDGENAWPNRKDVVAETIGQKYQADIAGLQEALKEQIDDLAARLPEYAWFGVGREDGKDKGEFTPIFYKTDRLELLDQNTFWLSETPEVPGSKSWDTAITRIVTWGKFKDKKTGAVFYHFNTHFDHMGRQARVESARLLSQQAIALAKDVPTVVTGDFNTREKSDPYLVLTGKSPFLAGASSDLKDARYLSNSPHKGPTSTTTNWKDHGEAESKIDYIFVRGEVEVLNHAALNDKYNGNYPSDHLPVLAEVRIPASSTRPAENAEKKKSQ